MERYDKRVEENHNQKFRATHIQMYDLEEPLILVDETSHHYHRKLADDDSTAAKSVDTKTSNADANAAPAKDDVKKTDAKPTA